MIARCWVVSPIPAAHGNIELFADLFSVSLLASYYGSEAFGGSILRWASLSGMQQRNQTPNCSIQPADGIRHNMLSLLRLRDMMRVADGDGVCSDRSP